MAKNKKKVQKKVNGNKTSKDKSEKKLKKNIEKFDFESLQKTLEGINMRLSTRRYLVRSFLGGIAQILGATIGIAIIFFFISRFLKRIESLPIISDLVAKTGLVQVVREEVEQYYDEQQ
ncbi:hypothetical protein GF362_07155 [Candidatus Dojkabacteria bacterium]|nr:hypothetical protein [Candidatus Dojkabacteria bacterium]